MVDKKMFFDAGYNLQELTDRHHYECLRLSQSCALNPEEGYDLM